MTKKVKIIVPIIVLSCVVVFQNCGGVSFLGSSNNNSGGGTSVTTTSVTNTQCAAPTSFPTSADPAPTIPYVKVAANTYSSCGLTAAGQAYCWGVNGYGELGTGNTTSSLTPVAVSQPNGLKFKDIKAYEGYVCALDVNDVFYCWGQNLVWSLNQGNPYDQVRFLEVPTAVPMPSGVSFTKFFGGGAGMDCGLTSGANLYCWGYNEVPFASPAAMGTAEEYTDTPSLMTGPAGGVLDASIGVGFECVLDPSGKAYCLGGNTYGGTLGSNTANSFYTPVAVNQPAGVAFKQIGSGLYFTCALSTAGQIYCWGTEAGAALNTATPTALANPDGVVFSSISMGFDHGCALSTAGRVYCWGQDGLGELGIGIACGSPQHTFPNPIPALLPSNLTFIQVSVGLEKTCALASNGQSYCWGVPEFDNLIPSASVLTPTKIQQD